MGEDYPHTLMELERRFHEERACAEYLAKLRWPTGWVCPRCEGRESWRVRRNRWRCGQCRYEVSVTAGTLFQDSHLPLTTWFRAMWYVAAQANGKGIGRIRLRCIPDLTRASLHGFIAQTIEPGSTVRTDGLPAYRELSGYAHEHQVQRRQPKGEHLLPRVHRVVSLLKRWLLGTHQGAVGHDHLDAYLDEFTFRFNRRTSASRGKVFYRLVQQAVQVDPAPFPTLVKPQSIGFGGVK